MRRIGVVCVGKDCPGINAAIRAVARRAFTRDMEVMGIRRGFQGLIEEDLDLITSEDVAGILDLGGTFLGISPFDPRENETTLDRLRDLVGKYRITLLVVMGGHTALGSAMALADRGVASITIPCTVDNDIAGTDYTVGFLTAADVVTEVLDRLHSNTPPDHRVVVVEVRGDAAGWTATLGGMAGGADFVFAAGPADATMDRLYETIRRRAQAGKAFTLVVVEERAPLPPSLARSLEKRHFLAGQHQFFGGAGLAVAEDLLLKFPHEVRLVTIGDIQRGGRPNFLDRVLATRLGYAAAEMAKAGRTNLLLGTRAFEVVANPYHPDLLRPKLVLHELYEVAAAFF